MTVAPGRETGVVAVALCMTAVLAATGFRPAAASAQNACFDGSTDVETGCVIDAPRWIGEFATLSVNGVIGGLTAGLARHFGGGSFADGFVAGAVGGVTTYAGKRVAAEGFTGAGAVGRMVSAAGASMVRNATSGELLLSRITVPIGPVWLEIRRGTAGASLDARVDPAALGWLVYGLAEPELHLDVGESLSAGAAVFRTRGKLLAFGDDETHAAGVTNAGVIFLADVPAYGESFERRALAHERVHVLQEDALAIMWTDPLAMRALEGLGACFAARYVAVNLSTELLRTLSGLESRHEERPWEMESIFLAR